MATIAGPLQRLQRPDAPYDLTDEEADEWRATVDRMPADWFPRETWPMLTQYCRHVVNARRISQLVQQELRRKKLILRNYNNLLIMQEREGRALSSLATRMRLTQQTTYDKSRKKGEVTEFDKPWES